MRRPLVVGNWKMNGDLSFISSFVSNFPKITNAVDLVLCPNVCHLMHLGQSLNHKNIILGAQTVSHFPNGAFTGETSISMLTELRCRYVIIGHSERRHIIGETQNLLTEKAKACMTHNLTPIYCIGENQQERDDRQTQKVIHAQLEPILIYLDKNPEADIVLAYEPVWAIGTGNQASNEQAKEICHTIRQTLGRIDAQLANQVRILYGGSVKPSNAAGLIAMNDIDGFLVGGAALQVDSLIEIINQCKP